MYAIAQSDSQQHNEQYLKACNDDDVQRCRKGWFGTSNDKHSDNSDENLLAVEGVRMSRRDK